MKREKLRIGVASIVQETNTWSPVPCTIDDFVCQGLALGPAAFEFSSTRTEIGGAIQSVIDGGHQPVPIMRAWANSSGRLTRQTLGDLIQMLTGELSSVDLDGLVLSLHGAMAAEGIDDADVALLKASKDALGPGIPIGVCLDLHANITRALVEESTFVIGFRTYPHTDLAETGGRAAELLTSHLRGEIQPRTVFAKRPMLLPAESMSTSSGPMARLRRFADDLVTDGVLDISLFPVQPWLDVEELGLGVTVTIDGHLGRSKDIAESVATRAWDMRDEFQVLLMTPRSAIEAARMSSVRPFLITESADAPTAGATGDSPAMIRALLEWGSDLEAYVTVSDPPAVDRCFEAGLDKNIDLWLGCHFEKRFDRPVSVRGRISHLGTKPVLITGPSYTGMEVSMGRHAVVVVGRLHILISERPAFTLDPATFQHAGLDPALPDLIVVRSALGFRAGFPPKSVAEAVVLDLPGASTPRIDLLEFFRAPRPLYPLDRDLEHVALST